MPFKYNASRRHHISTQKFRVKNWCEYETGLRQRGSITFWMSDEGILAWQAEKRRTRGGRPRYCDLAIETTMTLGLVFGLPLRQTEGCVADLGDQSAYFIEQGGAGVANIDGELFTVEEDGSGSYNGRDDQLILSGKDAGANRHQCQRSQSCFDYEEIGLN